MGSDPILHLLPQEAWHSPAAIVGNKEGLVVLKKAIEAALSAGDSCIDVFCEDGEGYRFAVACREDMVDVPYGYVDADARDGRSIPDWLVRVMTYEGGK